MKTTIFTLIAILTCTFSFAQTLNDWDKKVLDGLINKSPYIFIGKPVSYKVFKTVDGGLAKSVILNVTEVIKGNINKGTVEIVFPCSGTIDSIHNIVIGNETVIPQSDAIYFTTNAEEWALNSNIAKGWALNSKIANSNNLTLGINDFVPFNADNEITEINGRKWLSFNKVTEVYDYLEKNYGLKIDNSLYEKKNQIKLNDVKQNPEPQKTNSDTTGNSELYKQRLKNYNQYMQYVQLKLNNKTQSKANSCKEFFISEYIDGPNKNKVLEIFNPTDSVKSLNGYTIKIFQNGAPTPLEIQLQGNVNPKETYVISHPNADSDILAKANQTSNKMNFDGNDAVVLNQGISNYIDKIGEIGVNPGNGGWNVPPSGSTQLHDLRRKFPIDKGETDWNQGKNQWNVFPQDSLLNVKQHQNVCATLLTNDITFSYANPTETGTSPRYFEFDIMIEGNSNTYLDNTIFNIKYNSAAFGTNAVANNNVTVTKGSGFNTATYFDPNQYIGGGVDTIAIPFGSDPAQSSWYRTLVTTLPQQLMHIKIEIQNCNQPTDLQFINTSFTSGATWYVANANDDPNNFANNISYDNVYYQNPLSSMLCQVLINDFTSPVNAGVGDILTINGNNFRSPRGSGQVKFINADNCCSTYIQKLNNIDYISWTNTQIKIRVPFTVDSIYAPNGDTIKSGIGSGNFIVKNSLGDSAISYMTGYPFNVYYSIQNTSFINNSIYKKYKVNLINDNNNDGYTFRLDTNFNSNPAARGCIQKAIEDWKCVTGANIVLGTDTTLTYNPNDGINNIFFTSSLPWWVNASTKQSFWLCPLSDNTYQSEFDILINNTINWQYDTIASDTILPGKYDFYGAMLHEIGHVVLLGHVNDPLDVMFWLSNQGPLLPSQRVSLQQYTSPGDGGFYSVQSSSSVVYNGVCNVYKMVPQYVCNYSVKEIFDDVMNLNIYPNPTNFDFINVSYELKEHAKIKFITSDITGRIIDEMQPDNNNIGKHQEQINVDNLPAGIYFLILNINGKQQTNKFIKF